MQGNDVSPGQCRVCARGPHPKIWCSQCYQSLYCSQKCLEQDAILHRQECQLLQDENELARDLQDEFANVTSGQDLRQLLVTRFGAKGPFRFVLFNLKDLLVKSGLYWRHHHDMALQRMNLLIEEVDKMVDRVDWLHVSSILFGTCMIHNVINDTAPPGDRFMSNAWFQAYLWNFGEVLDRVKLFALLQTHQKSKCIPDDQFPLRKMCEPLAVAESWYFPKVSVSVTESHRVTCMSCGRAVKPGPVASSHSPNRSLSNEAKEVNFLPPRPLNSSSFGSKDQRDRYDQITRDKFDAWLQAAVRLKTFTKAIVCSDECEQHALYGRLFPAHPL